MVREVGYMKTGQSMFWWLCLPSTFYCYQYEMIYIFNTFLPILILYPHGKFSWCHLTDAGEEYVEIIVCILPKDTGTSSVGGPRTRRIITHYLPKLHKPKRGKKFAFQFELIGPSKPPDFAVVSRTTSLGVIFFLVLRCQGEPFKMALS